ncbi:phage tail protein [Amphibacillus sp. MSJ-3]|uniref:phage tail spike protein n=1 Tax=Amphibacillus sp. MSJ-3 TaxID=2841505 RepID=UPI001C0F1869|nr:phage tail spike protein [Amphibacillus sp. MSJ-3]MBU5594921.1 phage tail protein [Amphibacillus sp. MSJ-3]
MYPRLYKSNETNFNHNGLGLLSGSIKAVATEELNGLFELKIEYDNDGFLADVIEKEMIIKAKANDRQSDQLFRIYLIEKDHENDNLLIYAQHITYDLSKNFVERLVANNMSKRQVMELIGSSTAYEHPFTLTSPNVTTRSSTKIYRESPLAMVGGVEGSVLQIWGGQIERDNFNLVMHDRRGHDDGVLVTYKKNLTGLTAKFDISSLVTRIYPFIYKEATDDEPEQLITVPGKYIDSPYIDNYEMPYILPVDYSNEEGVETGQDLLNIAKDWFKETGRDNPKVEMEVQFEHLWETEEYKDVASLELVGMGDTITVRHSKLNVDGTAIVNLIEYDVIDEKNLSVEIGDIKSRLTHKVNDVENIAKKIDEVEKGIYQVIRTVDEKNDIYWSPDEPVGDFVEGDLWFKGIDGVHEATYRYDGIQWQLITSKDISDIRETANTAKNNALEAKEKAELATSNANEAINKAQTAFDETEALSKVVDTNTEDITSLTITAQGLQSKVSDAEENITTLTQLSTTMQADLRNAQGDIAQLTLTAESLQSVINDLEEETQSQITQLSNNINLRVEKSDVINQINISDEDILISGKKLILDGDTTVTGTFRVSNANITSVDAGKMTTGTLDAAQVNIINLNASNIKSGTLTGVRIVQESGKRRLEMYDGLIESYQDGNLTMTFGQYGIEFYNTKSQLIGSFSPVSGVSGRGIALTVDRDFFTLGMNIGGLVRPVLTTSASLNRTYLSGPYNGLVSGARLQLFGNRRAVSEDEFVSRDQPTIILDQSSTTNDIYQYFGGLNRRANAIWEVRHNYEAESWRSILLAESSGVTSRYKMDIREASGFTQGVRLGSSSIATSNQVHVITRHTDNNNMMVYPQRYTNQPIFSVRSHNGRADYRDDLIIKYNGDIEGKKFVDSSLAETKDNITPWNCSALDIINQADLYEWTRGSDKKEYGFVIGDGYRTPEEVISESGSGISNYSHRSLNTKAIQELDLKVNHHIESTALKIAQLEQRVQKLEVA